MLLQHLNVIITPNECGNDRASSLSTVDQFQTVNIHKGVLRSLGFWLGFGNSWTNVPSLVSSEARRHTIWSPPHPEYMVHQKLISYLTGWKIMSILFAIHCVKVVDLLIFQAFCQFLSCLNTCFRHLEYLIGQNFVGRNFCGTKFLVGQKFWHQVEISTILSDFWLTFVLKYWTKFSTDKMFRRTKFSTPSLNFDTFVRRIFVR